MVGRVLGVVMGRSRLLAVSVWVRTLSLLLQASKGRPAPYCQFNSGNGTEKAACRQRSIVGYRFCIRHILQDPNAPYRSVLTHPLQYWRIDSDNDCSTELCGQTSALRQRRVRFFSRSSESPMTLPQAEYLSVNTPQCSMTSPLQSINTPVDLQVHEACRCFIPLSRKKSSTKSLSSSLGRSERRCWLQDVQPQAEARGSGGSVHQRHPLRQELLLLLHASHRHGSYSAQAEGTKARTGAEGQRYTISSSLSGQGTHGRIGGGGEEHR